VGQHSGFIKSISYNLSSCKGCHGQDYGTTKVNNSCLTCHTKPGGPEACNTCHGNFSGDPANLANVAPPRGLNGETATTTPAVGAHQAHLAYPSAALAEKCQQCHALPQNFAAPGHIDPDGKIELLFNGDVVNLATEGGTRVPNVSYNTADNTCAGTYCHGNWGLLKASSQYTFIYTADKMEGDNASPKWTDSASGACGTCHGLPPNGHLPLPLTDCTQCHSGVVDATGKIIDNTKHVNGKVNVFMQEYPMF
jgi:predicted CxxxxCH...CXXCH cytochrome family protein